MASPEGASARPRIIVNADDFGFSPGVNEAVARAHAEGILTSASLMVTGAAAGDAVRIARELPRLGVGLHLTLVRGHSALPPSPVRRIADRQGRLPQNPVFAGFRFWARRDLRDALRAEIVAQLERFRATGLPLDHVNGHLHLHMHPVVSALLCELAGAWSIRRMRLTCEPWGPAVSRGAGRLPGTLAHAAVFRLLARRARLRWARAGILHADRVFGLLADGRMDEQVWLRLLARLPTGISEIYSHPSADLAPHELAALTSRAVREAMNARGMEPIRYSEIQPA